MLAWRLFFVFAGFFDGGEERIFDVLFLFLLGRSLEDDVDVVAGELAGEADVLALLADGDGLLILGDVDFGFLAVEVDFHDFGRA